MTEEQDCRSPYAPIRDYALIGDCHGSALVARDGSIDWCSLVRFDADPVFCRILDAGKGGYFQISADEPAESTRAYIYDTAILQTCFTAASGSVRVTDFMPVGRRPDAGEHDYVSLRAPYWLVRLLDCVDGAVDVRVRYRPSVEFARAPARLVKTGSGISVPEGPALFAPDVAFSLKGDVAEAGFPVQQGERYCFVVMAEPDEDGPFMTKTLVDDVFRTTQAFWREWALDCHYRGPYQEAVLRSALTLKLLTYAPTGAIVAAPTCSLPEAIGGERNWDYRYCWLRDATFTLYALTVLGYSGEARRFSDFLYEECKGAGAGNVIQIMYGINGETTLTETLFDHLEGYRKSRPVRNGNAAYDQEQLDAYGEVIAWAYLYQSLGGQFGRRERETLVLLADYIKDHWQEGGQSIWEIRGPPRHYVYGKIMCWVALDNAERLFGVREGWTSAREQILEAIEAHGLEPGKRYLRQAFDHPATDASLLLASLVGFPLGENVLQATIEQIRQELGRGDFLHRYKRHDYLAGQEGAFLICSFWLVDALLVADRYPEAKALYERLLNKANDVGLFSEEIDPDTGEFLGNFSQAFTHLALINNAAHLALFSKEGAPAMQGTRADRIHRVIEIMTGFQAHWAMLKETGRKGAFRPTSASKLELGHRDRRPDDSGA
ncbi:glycoside hydrolase family 15 protein [Methylobacter sp. BBA5.1]|uniref:glycoside hydrolase family 15 protein n=1 Tax=Methylobacter sp. BBA5.1 TaxID=1495064 RepID=UPI0006895904|nr:glycoside hydrolase family 15 protein [Methylobacter sp. BBA5.1]